MVWQEQSLFELGLVSNMSVSLYKKIYLWDTQFHIDRVVENITAQCSND